jgi:hypothetical protein
MSLSSVSNFKSQFNVDPARANRFTVSIAPIGPLNFNSTFPIEYACHVSQLPGKTFVTTDQRTYGPIEKYPYLATYGDLDLTFYVDGDMMIKDYFDQWMRFISDISITSNDIGYKGDYCTSITIKQFDTKNKQIYGVECIEAYPVSMNQLDLDWSSESFHNLTVTFAYTYWTLL